MHYKNFSTNHEAKSIKKIGNIPSFRLQIQLIDFPFGYHWQLIPINGISIKKLRCYIYHTERVYQKYDF